MRTSTASRRRVPALRAVTLVAAALLGLTGCGNTIGDPNAAAVVNGVSLPLATVQSRFESVSRDPELAQQLAADADGTFKARVQARILSQMVQAELLSQAAAAIGIKITEDDVDTERQAIIDQVGGQEAFDQLVADNNLTDAEVRSQLRDLVVERRVEETLSKELEVSDADVQAFYEQNQATRYDKVRASHILVDSKERADELMAQARAGADFAKLAEEHSSDTGSATQGGDLGEFTRGRLVPEFEEAAFGADVGDLVGPIETQFGWHLILITSRTRQTLDDVRDEITTELSQERLNTARAEFRQAHFADAEVLVNPRLGTWNPTAGEVEAGDPLGNTTALDPVLGPGQGIEPEGPIDDDHQDGQ